MSHTLPRPTPSIGDVLVSAISRTAARRPTMSGAVHRTGAPVRRDSLEAGTFEDTFFAVPAKGDTDKMLLLARKAVDEGRRLRRVARDEDRKLTVRERAIAAITPAAARVFEEFCTLARLCAGRVYPSYDHLAEQTHLGRRTIARVLPLLEEAGFLIRQRRFTKVDDDGPGPRYRQTSNAYRPLLPTRLLALLPRWARPAPLPVDAVHREADRQGETQAMLAQLTAREFARATLSGPLADVFARLGASIDAQSA